MSPAQLAGVVIFSKWLLTAAVLVGCGVAKAQGAEFFGTFSSGPAGQFIDAGQRPLFELSSEFSFDDPNGLKWKVPKGTKVDGASIPQALRSIIGGPFEGAYLKASVIHDYFITSARPRAAQLMIRIKTSIMACVPMECPLPISDRSPSPPDRVCLPLTFSERGGTSSWMLFGLLASPRASRGRLVRALLLARHNAATFDGSLHPANCLKIVPTIDCTEWLARREPTFPALLG